MKKLLILGLELERAQAQARRPGLKLLFLLHKPEL